MTALGGLNLKRLSNAPDATSLMMSARSFGNYDLPSALADLVDNSVKAEASSLWINCNYGNGEPSIKITDDGYGMNEAELVSAMRPASTNPDDKRAPNDLGRFGWGLKSASLSQCRRLTVISRKDGVLTGAIWDLDDCQDWQMIQLDDLEAKKLAGPKLSGASGTEVIWTRCDRLSENGSMSESEFNAAIIDAEEELSLIFHRFLSGTNLSEGRTRLKIMLNDREIAPRDPFKISHPATQLRETETLMLKGHPIVIKPYILPHHSKLSREDHQKLGGKTGYLRSQGFYVYRNDRLLHYGTWFGLMKFGQLSQLVRISIDFPNALDSIWKITVDKRDAQLPTSLRNRLRQILHGLRGQSSRVYRSRGGKLGDKSVANLWSRYARNGEVRYVINRSHPLIARLESENEEVRDVFSLIEQTFPIAGFANDAKTKMDDIRQVSADRDKMQNLIRRQAPHMLAEANGDFDEMEKIMKSTEPFSTHWKLTVEILEEMKWRK